MSNEEKRIFLVFRMVAILMLLLAIDRHQSVYFTLLRFLVTTTAIWSSWVALGIGRTYWILVMGGIAVLFNPIIPIYLEGSTWAFIDILTAVAFIISFFSIKPQVEDYGE